MEVHFAPEVEAKLTEQAARQGRNPHDLVNDAVKRYIEEEARFVAAVTRGEEAITKGDFLSHEQVGLYLSRFVKA